MLPVIASMIMGGLFKQSTNQMQAGGFPAAGNNPLGDIIEQMMRQGGGMMGGGQPQPRQTQQPANPFDNPFGKILQDMFGGAAGQQAPQQPRQAPGGAGGGFGDNPLGKIFEEMMRGGQARQPAPEPEEEPQPRQRTKTSNPSGRARNPYDDLFGEMFETGAKQRDDYQKGVENIFEQFRRGMERPR